MIFFLFVLPSPVWNITKHSLLQDVFSIILWQLCSSFPSRVITIFVHLFLMQNYLPISCYLEDPFLEVLQNVHIPQTYWLYNLKQCSPCISCLPGCRTHILVSTDFLLEYTITDWRLLLKKGQHYRYEKILLNLRTAFDLRRTFLLFSSAF